MVDHRKVLVVEDNDMNMQLVEYLLEEGGYSIVKATSGEEALSITRSDVDRPDLILMDIHLPGMAALSVLREINPAEQPPRLPTLARPAHPSPADRAPAPKLGSD